jgi:hypothetical protein
LVANEAQDIEIDRWDAVFDPMAARRMRLLFPGYGVDFTTLLARQMRHLRELEAQDGFKRVWLVDWEQVAKYVPAYGERVKARIAQFGENHPFIQTEYFLKELDGNGGLFGAERRALMVGSHPRRESAEAGKIYALWWTWPGRMRRGLEGEELRSLEPKKDSDGGYGGGSGAAQPPGLGAACCAPQCIRLIGWCNRYVWTGVKHTDIHGRLVGLARDTWRAKYVVVDATGVGAPVASFLAGALGKKVIPFTFSSVSKSELGWNFCGVIDSGRFKDYAPDGADDTAWWWRQLAAVEYEVRPGPGQLMKWAVPDPALHDDLVMSAALVAVLDGQDWRPRTAVGVADRVGW